MPNTGPKKPIPPIDVLVQDVDRPSAWQLAAMHEWRWIDESAGTWEGHVILGGNVREWIDGHRLRRVEGSKQPREYSDRSGVRV